MKAGKVSESILKRSVFKQLHMKNDSVTIGPFVGGDYSTVSVDHGEQLVLATNPMTWEVTDTKTYANMAVHTALNNVATSGAQPVGILVDVLLPTIANEAQLRELMKEMDLVCGEAGAQIMGGHTQVTRAVKSMVVTTTGVGRLAENVRKMKSQTAEGREQLVGMETTGQTDVALKNSLEIAQKQAFNRKEVEVCSLLSNRNIKPGMDIIATKWIGLLGTALLAQEHEAELRNRYSQPFIDKAKTFSEYISIQSEAAVAVESGVCAMHDMSEGGVFGALWEMAEAAGVGLDIDLKKIPIRQETVEICEFFDINPYKMLSGGSLLIATEDGNRVLRELEQAGIPATIIGVTTESNDRVLIQGEERRFLETAQTDELYKIK